VDSSLVVFSDSPEGVTIKGAAGAVVDADTVSIFALGFVGMPGLKRVKVASDGSFSQLMAGAVASDIFRLLALRPAERVHSTPLDVTVNAQGQLVAPQAADSCIKLSDNVYEVSAKVYDTFSAESINVSNDCSVPRTVLEAHRRLGSPHWAVSDDISMPTQIAPAEVSHHSVDFFPQSSGLAEDVWLFKVQSDIEPFYEAHLVTLIGYGDP